MDLKRLVVATSIDIRPFARLDFAPSNKDHRACINLGFQILGEVASTERVALDDGPGDESRDDTSEGELW